MRGLKLKPKNETVSQPWRSLPESKKSLDYLTSYKPRKTEAKHLRILLHGPVGAGKSSFINSVDSVFQGRVTGRALADATSGKSFTKKYKTYKIQNDSGSCYSFIFNDIMGFEETTNNGVHVDDVKLALTGHVKEGYEFDSKKLLKEEDEGYNSHCQPVIWEFLNWLFSPKLMKPVPKAKENTENVYVSDYLKETVEKFSMLLGIPVNCIFLVKNYSSEVEIDDGINNLILCALRQIVAFGEDYLNNLSKKSLDFVKSYKPKNKEIKHLRILLHGPVGAGKSSFINSVESVLQGRVTGRALTDAASGKSFTKKYKTYEIQNDPGSFYSFIFNDTMGFDETPNNGVHVDDVKLALTGHVKEGYEFDPKKPLKEEDEGYNSCPTLDDKVHVLVSVLPASLVSSLSDGAVKKMRDVRLLASKMGIPQLAVLTKVEKFSMLLGIPVNCIFLVKNYSSEVQIDDGINNLILCALRQIVAFGEDYLNNL
ncbi:hypothetical protein Q5P01_017468 [Channa striata]|uniref:Interferon-induced protein 44-like n=1 Tax=Channa striata TaxID=64152 RepID=A0AA88MAW7_CHASR|nr:hypothetical protein Q5P01_017468 [Channa striata]